MSQTTGAIGSPFHFQDGDNPGIALVLVGDNYASWSRSTVMALNDKNKIGFFDGTIHRPDDVDKNFKSGKDAITWCCLGF